MNQICQNCKTKFKIEPDDVSFYEKIQVPVPTFCPECRSQRRLAFRNERNLYKRKCDKCSKDIVSMYVKNSKTIVWCHDCWFADDWDPKDYGQEYDSNKSFMEQFNVLWQKIPKVALIHVRSVNSEYINLAADNKNCYMIFESSNNEDAIHSYWIQQCRDVIDSSFSHECETCYEVDDCYNCNKLLYSKGCYECRESYFLFDCKNCVNCLGCVNERNSQYKIFNKQYSKEEYEEYIKNAKLDTQEGVEKFRKEFEKFKLTQPHKFAEINRSTNATGNYINNAKNIRQCFHSYEAENCAYSNHVWRDAKDCMDCDTSGRGAELIYNSTNTGLKGSNCICCTQCWGNNSLTYCTYCFDSHDLFGCSGLRKQSYCILNKQYSKEEYNKLKEQIIESMKKDGTYGEFYSPSMSMFGYNESSAQEQFPLTKEEAISKGYKWEDTERGVYGKEDGKTIFACRDCKKNFLIIDREFEFYKKLSIPLPIMCPDCRHSRRIGARGPNKLWKGTCMCTQEHPHHRDKCPNEFQTSYSPNRQEIIYCEQCYQNEVV